jgi:hypothetical protein
MKILFQVDSWWDDVKDDDLPEKTTGLLTGDPPPPDTMYFI